MSEYQYYEFLAVDQPLTPQQIDEVRELSSRAEITSTSFSNEYDWGNFRGEPEELLRLYYDLFLYLSNWGTYRFAFTVPSDLVDEATLDAYASDDGERLSVTKVDDLLLIEFNTGDDEAGDEWVEASGMMASLAPIRAEVMAGDLRSLYIGWVGHARYDFDETTLEPPLPPGMQKLTAAQQALADLLNIDQDLLEVAAAESTELSDPSDRSSEIGAWLRALPAAEKDDLLVRFVTGSDPWFGQRMKLRYHKQHAPPAAERPRRPISELLRAAERREMQRKAEAAEEAAKAKQQREAKAAAERAERLQRLAGNQPRAWQKVDDLLNKTQKTSYAQAVTLLVDLRDAAAQAKALDAFEERVRQILQTHIRKSSCTRMIREAELLRR